MTIDLPESTDVVVIGSGILGAAIAWNLADAGVQVAVVERGDFCGEASGANIGLITVSTRPPGFLLELSRRGVELYPRLSEILGADVRFEQSGGIVVATTPEGLIARRALTEAQRRVGINVHHVTTAEILELEPILPPTITGGSFCPDDGHVYPFAVVAAYLEAAQRLGAILIPATEVTDITISDGRVTGVETSRGPIRATYVVNAAGSWAGEVSAMAGLYTPIVPVRGQVLLTERMHPFTKHVVLGINPSIRQTWAGNGLIGATTEYAGHEKANTLQTLRHYAIGIAANYPGLEHAMVIRSWSGLRPGTPDELPVIGESRTVRGFIIATGAFRNGMAYGPAIGEIVSDIVLGRAMSIDITDASPERFGELPEAIGAVA